MTDPIIHAEYSRSPWSGRGNLKQLVDELQRQKENTFDFVSDCRNLAVEVRPGLNDEPIPFLMAAQTADPRLHEWLPRDGAPISKSAVADICLRLKPLVPIKFARALIEDKPLVAADLLSQLLLTGKSTNLVRMLDGKVRAFLSDRYQPLDNYTLAFNAMEVAKSVSAEIIEASIGEHHMRIKFTSRQLWGAVNDLKQGDRSSWYTGGLGNQDHLRRVGARTRGDMPGGPGTIHPVVTIENSETGKGGLHVRVGIMQAVCFNLATVESVVSNIHLGSRIEAGIFSQETIRLDAETVMSKASDAIATAFNSDRFDALVAKVNGANAVAIKPVEAVNFAVQENVITETQKDALLAHFMGESAGGMVGDTAYGFAQAISRLAQDTEDGDDAFALEEFAGKIINKPSLVAAK